VVEDTPYRALRHGGHVAAHAEEPRHRGPGPTSRQLFQDSGAGAAAGLGGSEPGDPRAARRLKLAADTQNSTLNMAAISNYFSCYDIDPTSRVLSRSTVTNATECSRRCRRSSRHVHFTEADGGLSSWLTFPPDFDAAALMADTPLPRLHTCLARPSPGHAGAEPRPTELFRGSRRSHRAWCHRDRLTTAAVNIDCFGPFGRRGPQRTRRRRCSTLRSPNRPLQTSGRSATPRLRPWMFLDGAYLATASEDRKLRVWRIQTASFNRRWMARPALTPMSPSARWKGCSACRRGRRCPYLGVAGKSQTCGAATPCWHGVVGRRLTALIAFHRLWDHADAFTAATLGTST
jgi:hypothetical protein